jgi:hypothetical protein
MAEDKAAFGAALSPHRSGLCVGGRISRRRGGKVLAASGAVKFASA